MAGLGAQWTSRDWPLVLSAAQLWRQEDGTQQSRNGLGQHAGRPGRGRQQALWRLSAQQSLVGAGASLVAAEAGLDAYARQRRLAAALGYSASPWVDLRVERGRERAGAASARYLALRLLLHWDRAVDAATPAGADSALATP